MLLTLFQGFDTPVSFTSIALLLGVNALWALVCLVPLTWVGRWLLGLGNAKILLLGGLASVLLYGYIFQGATAMGGDGAPTGLLLFLVPLMIVFGLFGVSLVAFLMAPAYIALGLTIMYVFYWPFGAFTGGGGAGFLAFVLMLAQWWKVFSGD